jgi:hypothetical protein
LRSDHLGHHRLPSSSTPSSSRPGPRAHHRLDPSPEARRRFDPSLGARRRFDPDPRARRHLDLGPGACCRLDLRPGAHRRHPPSALDTAAQGNPPPPTPYICCLG